MIPENIYNLPQVATNPSYSLRTVLQLVFNQAIEEINMSIVKCLLISVELVNIEQHSVSMVSLWIRITGT